MLKGSLQVRNIRLQLLFHAEGLGLALALSLQGSLHAIDGLHEVLPGAVKLFLLLTNAALNLLPDLGQLQLGTQDLVFFLLQSTFSLLKGSLQLHFLSLQALP